MQELRIIVDNRERNLEILEGLEEHNIEITFAQLPVGDYIVSDRMCIERKTISDFESSIMNARLFDQVKRLHESFEKSILILEGDSSELILGKNVMLGTILKLYIDHNIQVLLSEDPEETAYILSRLAEREQSDGKREPRLGGKKRAFSTYQWQVQILSSIPGIGVKLSNNLIRHFKTLKNVATANEEELTEIDKIGKKKARRIYEILNVEFKEDL